MRSKNFSRLGLLLLVVFLLAAGGSVAYFVTSETAHNVVSTSGVSIALYELAGPAEIQPFHDLENITPGTTYSKIPYIENTDTEPVWVRAKISLIQTTGDGTETPVTDFSSLMTLQNLGTHWLLNSDDGFYYYDSALSTGERTESIFQSVKFADTIGDEYQLATYSLTVTAEATQVTHNGTSGLDASWTESGGI